MKSKESEKWKKTNNAIDVPFRNDLGGYYCRAAIRSYTACKEGDKVRNVFMSNGADFINAKMPRARRDKERDIAQPGG